jgi:hypothetical protein
MTTSTASQILFIDSRVTNADSLLASIDSNIEIVWLSADRDGLEHIADALATMEGLALAQQANVQFVAGVALYPLRQELHRIVAGEAGQPLAERAAGDDQRQCQQGGRLPARRGDHIEAAAHIHLDIAVEEVIERRRGNREQGKPDIAQLMGHDPAHWPAAIEMVFVLELELALAHAASLIPKQKPQSRRPKSGKYTIAQPLTATRAIYKLNWHPITRFWSRTQMNAGQRRFRPLDQGRVWF